MLTTARAVQALGAAVLVPTSLSLVLPEFPAAQRATATSLWTATGAVTAAVGPSLGGLLVSQQGWRWVFFANLLIGAPLLIPAHRLLRESRDDAPTGWPDALGAVLLTGAVAALALAVVKGGDRGWSSNRLAGSLAASAVLLALFVVRSARHPAPVVELSPNPIVHGGRLPAGLRAGLLAGLCAIALGRIRADVVQPSSAAPRNEPHQLIEDAASCPNRSPVTCNSKR